MKKYLSLYNRLPRQLKFVITATVYVFFFLLGYDIPTFCAGGLGEVLQNVMYEIHGLFFDLLILTSIFLVLQTFQEESEKAEAAYSFIKEKNYSPDPIDIKNKCKAIKTLNSMDETQIVLYQTVLTHGELQNVRLLNTDLYSCNFDEVFFWDGWLNGTSFTECTFTETRFDGAKMNNVSFLGCTFGDSRFHFTELKEAKFIKEVLNKVYFQRAILTDADFTEAVLIDTDFRAADLTGAIFNDAIVPFGWFDRLEIWEVIGRDQIIQNYEPVEVSPGKYRLKNRN